TPAASRRQPCRRAPSSRTTGSTARLPGVPAPPPGAIPGGCPNPPGSKTGSETSPRPPATPHNAFARDACAAPAPPRPPRRQTGWTARDDSPPAAGNSRSLPLLLFLLHRLAQCLLRLAHFLARELARIDQ